MKNIYFLLLLLVTSTLSAQVSVQGVVKDSIGTPLELANIIAINKETKTMASYAISNDKGRYKLDLEKNTTYNIQVSYIGMKTFSEELATKEENITKDYTLQNDNTLDEVQLTYEMPVTIKGDTLVYNADSFKDGTERKLEDVLKKLPGVEINDDGQIEVEGKVVSKVMVDGKDFFDGDSKLATKNIPSNAVDKVQVLKNYANVGQLSGVTNNQDNVAINIKLKEGKENFWFGDVTAGAGVADDNGLYIVQPKLFYYSPKYSINLIGDLNNIGEVAFTRRDFFNFSGGFNPPSQQSGTNINLGNNNLGFLTLQNNQAKSIQTKFGAANFSYSPKKTLDLSGFAIFTSSRIDLQENRSVRYTDSDLGIPDEDTESKTNQKSDLALFKLKAKYQPNSNNQLDYAILGRTSKESQDQNFTSSVVGSTLQFEENSPYSINQDLNYYYTLNDNNIFALEAQHLIQDEDPFYNALLQNDPTNNDASPEDRDPFDNTAAGLGFDQTLDNYNVAQDKRIKSNQLDAKLDYWNILNNKSNINFTLGTILSRQDFDSNIFQFLDNGTVFDSSPTFNNGLDTNDVAYNFSDLYLGVHYRLKSGMFTFTPGFSAHAYGAKNTQFGTEYKDNFFRLLPDVNVRMELKKSENIEFNYRMQTEFTDVTQLAQGLVMNNYDSYFTGNQTLKNGTSHTVSLRYFSFNMFNYTNVFGNLTYSKRIDQIRNLSNFESIIRTSSPFNSGFADETFSAFGRFQRSFKKIRATLSGNFTYSKFNQFIQNRRSINESYNQNYRAQLRTNFREAPNVEVSYRYGINNNKQGGTNTTFFTHAPTIEFDAYIWKTITFRTDFTYNETRDKSRSLNDNELWNASLSYRKDKDAKMEYELKGTNLLNTQSRFNTSQGNFSVSATEYFIQPRFLTFRVIYSL
ncbi:carboxypeptidase regulatory-like domain-containing protein [Psychroserpens sp. XS_ASV72]|uniref:carboxypeptidase regulatory-like domain-containing protein n=1 Tax=Psychroserpens sp. XS_ASV72 TaxID=3241293 RepID=UPI00351801AC